MFDDLPGAGRPIRDLDRIRQPGWWATRLVKNERSLMKSETLEREIALAMPAIWRLETAPAVIARVGELNTLIDRYNRSTTLDRRTRLDPADMVERWQVVRPRTSDA